MRKFKDMITGAILETDNEFVIEQYLKYADRYREIKGKAESKK